MENLKGKRECKMSFCREARISDRKAPLFGMVSRLSSQKGIDQLLHALDDLIWYGPDHAVARQGDEALPCGVEPQGSTAQRKGAGKR